MLKAPNILAAISELNKSSVLISNGRNDLTYTALIKYLHQHKLLLSKFTEKSISLFFSNDFMTAIWLAILDGISARITLIPNETNIEQLPKILNKTGTDYIISDAKDLELDCHIYIESTLTCSYDEHLTDTNSFARNTNTSWVLLTSGTTGEPKLVKHSFSSLTHTVKTTTHAEKYTWGLLYGISRFAGLQVFLQAILSGSRLIIADEYGQLSDKIVLFSKMHVNAISATPTYWRKILMSPEHKLLDLATITLGGEIADQRILDMLKSSYRKAKIRHIYASTEAGAGFSVSDGQAGFPSHYLSTSHQPNMKLSDHRTLMIRSPTQSQGYIDNKLPIDEDGYIDTGDLLEVKNGRCLFLGRENGVINVGGNKVCPETVESVLLEHPDIKMASVSAKKSPITGSIVLAKIVPKTGKELDKQTLKENIRSFCKGKLLDHMIPVIIKIENELKINPSGKVIRE